MDIATVNHILGVRVRCVPDDVNNSLRMVSGPGPNSRVTAKFARVGVELLQCTGVASCGCMPRDQSFVSWQVIASVTQSGVREVSTQWVREESYGEQRMYLDVHIPAIIGAAYNLMLENNPVSIGI